MRWIAVPVLVASSVMLFASVVPAQDATSRSADLDQQRKQRRYVVQPKPDPQALTQDVDQATAALAAGRRFDQVVRETRSPIGRRPNLDYDVTSGIQSQNIRAAGPSVPR